MPQRALTPRPLRALLDQIAHKWLIVPEQLVKQGDSQTRCTPRRHVRPPSSPGTPDHNRVNARFACRTAFMPDGVTRK
jgi:hypothetical protein